MENITLNKGIFRFLGVTIWRLYRYTGIKILLGTSLNTKRSLYKYITKLNIDKQVTYEKLKKYVRALCLYIDKVATALKG